MNLPVVRGATIEAREVILANFSVVSLGIDSPGYFQGFGSGEYAYSTYGIGDTEAEALEDCMEMMAQSCGFDFTDKVERRIRREFGKANGRETVADALGLDEDADD